MTPDASGNYRPDWQSGEENTPGASPCAEGETVKSEVRRKFKQQANP
jgi:hypothetical protein